MNHPLSHELGNEQASQQMSAAEQSKQGVANEWAVRVKVDRRVAQYFSQNSRMFWTLVCYKAQVLSYNVFSDNAFPNLPQHNKVDAGMTTREFRSLCVLMRTSHGYAFM